MPYLSIVKAVENQGPPPEGLLAAMNRFVAQSLKDRSLIQTGGLAPSAAGFAAARRFMDLHVQHWPAWEGECEVREVVFLAP